MCNVYERYFSEPIEILYTKMEIPGEDSSEAIDLKELDFGLDCLCLNSSNDYIWVNCKCSEPRPVHCQSGFCRFRQYNNSNIYGGVKNPASTESACMEACRGNASCQGIDWTPGNKAGEQCDIHSKMTDRNSGQQGVTHYDFICNEFPSTYQTRSPPPPEKDTFSNVSRCYDAGDNRVCFFTPENATKLTFSSATQWCKENNATLPIIRNNVDQKILENFLETTALPIYNMVWTSNHKINTGVWRWINGQPFQGTNNNNLPQFASFEFCRRSPETLEQKGQLLRSIDSNKRPNSSSNAGYICQFPGFSCPSNGIRTRSNECQVVNEGQLSWYEARNRCFHDGGDLATFEDVSNIEKLAPLLAFDKSYHIGLENSTWYWYQPDKFKDITRYTNMNKGHIYSLRVERGLSCRLPGVPRFGEVYIHLFHVEKDLFCMGVETFTYKWIPCNCDLALRFVCQRIEPNDGSEITVHWENLDRQTPHRKNDGSETNVQSEKLDRQTSSRHVPSSEGHGGLIIAGVEGFVITILIVVLVSLVIYHRRRRDEYVLNYLALEMRANADVQSASIITRNETSTPEYQELDHYSTIL